MAGCWACAERQALLEHAQALLDRERAHLVLSFRRALAAQDFEIAVLRRRVGLDRGLGRRVVALRLGLAAVLLFVGVTVASADCQGDLAATARYSGLLERSQQVLQRQVATLQAELDLALAAHAKLETEKKALEQKLGPTPEDFTP